MLNDDDNGSKSEGSGISGLLNISRAGSLLLNTKSNDEQKLEEKVRLADDQMAKRFEESLKVSGRELASIKKMMRESLDPLRQVEGLSPLLAISKGKGNILSHGLKVVSEKMHAQVAAIFLIGKNGTLQRVSIYGLDKNGVAIEPDWYAEETYSVDKNSLVGRTAVPEAETGYGRFQYTANLEEENNLDQKSKAKYFETFGTLRKAITAPLNGRHKTYGVLRIINTVDPQSNQIVEDSEFKDADVIWLSLLATYIANALSNFRRDLQTQILQHLHYRLANPFPFDDSYYENILSYYQEALDLLVMNSETDFKAGVLRLVDDRTQTLKVVATSTFSSEVERNNEPRRIGEGFAGSVAESCNRLILTDISEEDFHNKEWVYKNSFKSFSCFPLISRRKLFGTLSLYSGYKDNYHTDKINFLQSIAESIATHTLLEFFDNKQRMEKLFEAYENSRKWKLGYAIRNEVGIEGEREIAVDKQIKESPLELGPSNKPLNKREILEKKPSQGKESDKIYRFALPQHPSKKQSREFEQIVQSFDKDYPEWHLFQDSTRAGEKQAFICVRKDEVSLYSYFAHTLIDALQKMFDLFR